MGIAELLEKSAEYLPPDKVALIERAYRCAERAHDGQLRASGEPYIQHPLHAAYTVATLQLDAAAIAAALLHDVVEDCGVPLADIEREFGAEVARLVEGTTKLSRIEWKQQGEARTSADQAQAENLRKMFLAMAEDVRVVIIKLADRLHNMRTLDALPSHKQLRIAAETMEIYAPLASRLGIWQIKWELEDLSFRHLQPEKYREIASLVAAKRQTRERYIAQVERILSEELARHDIKAEISGRPKHIHSIYRKMEKYAQQGKTFNDIHDLLALRVLVETVADCYNALGVTHSLWHPLPGSFDDYIANPKESMYQSLHTTVVCLGAKPLEVQIRTYEMHRVAEYGIAAHWRYKEGGAKRDSRYEERLNWLRQLLEWQREVSGAEEFIESVKTDIFRDQVFVYTPQGDVHDLPAGSTPIDFAYRIHTDLGHRCVGAKVNGRLVSLTYQLRNGDIVEIMTSKTSRGPSRDWLNPNLGYVRTSHAREKMRQWFRKAERAENIEKGRELLDREARKLGIELARRLDDVLALFKYENADDFYAALGYGGVNAHQLSVRLASLIAEPAAPAAPRDGRPSGGSFTANIQVLGSGDLLTQLARCCNPVPGDSIVGYVTRSRGVTVHRADCHNVLYEDEPERLVEVQWGRQSSLYPVSVRIEAWDRVGLLRDVSTLVAEEKVNMTGVRTQEHGDHTTTVYLTLETTGIEQLSRLLNKLEGIKAVFSVSRAPQEVHAGSDRG